MVGALLLCLGSSQFRKAQNQAASVSDIIRCLGRSHAKMGTAGGMNRVIPEVPHLREQIHRLRIEVTDVSQMPGDNDRGIWIESHLVIANHSTECFVKRSFQCSPSRTDGSIREICGQRLCLCEGSLSDAARPNSPKPHAAMHCATTNTAAKTTPSKSDTLNILRPRCGLRSPIADRSGDARRLNRRGAAAHHGIDLVS